MFRNDDKYVLMFQWKRINTWKIDSPITLDKIHKQCYATKEQCIAIIKELHEKGNIDHVPGFIEVPLQHFTLDDMLDFKREDEMALRGQDPFM